MNPPKIKLFLCYAQEDLGWARSLSTAFAPHADRYEIWFDQELRAGQHTGWEDELLHHLGEADGILCLLSRHFFASTYVMDKELPLALERHENKLAQVFFIHAVTCDLPKGIHGHHVILPDKERGLSAWRGGARDAAVRDIVRKIRGETEAFAGARPVLPVSEPSEPAAAFPRCGENAPVTKVARKPVRRGEEFTFLHISDLHTYPAPDPLRAHEHLLERLAPLQERHALDCVFFTGDGFGPTGDETIVDAFERTGKLLSGIRDIWRLEPGAFFLIPGDRDSTERDVPVLFQWLDGLLAAGQDGCNLVNDQFSKDEGNIYALMNRFRTFRDHLSSRASLELLTGPDKFMSSHVHSHRGFKIGIGGLNTAWSARRFGEKKGRAWFAARHQISSLADELNQCDFRIALHHHPLSWGNQFEAEWEPELRARFHLSLHGHESAPSHRMENHVALSAGAGAGKAGPDFRYHVVTLNLKTGLCKVLAQVVGSDLARPPGADGSFEFQFSIREKSSPKPPPVSPPKTWPTRSKPSLEAGIILVADFFEFAGRTHESQRRALQVLFEAVRDLGAIWLPLPAGVVLCWPDPYRRRSAVDVLNSISRIEQRLAEAKELPHLRFSLHSDAFSLLAVKGKGNLAGGAATNDAVWMAHLGEARDIAMSEAFHDDYFRKEMVGLPETSPLWNFPRSDRRSLGVFMCIRSKDAPNPYRLRIMEATEVRIKKELQKLEALFRESISKAIRINPRQLQARISLWEKQRVDGKLVLCPTRFRFQNGGEKYEAPGRALYLLEGEGQGPVGQAVMKGKVIVCRALPNWADDSAGYLRRMEAYGLDDQDIGRWQRKSRSFICFPLSMIEVGREATADAAVCIDCAHPLAFLTASRLRQIGEVLRNAADLGLAPLWQLKSAR